MSASAGTHLEQKAAKAPAYGAQASDKSWLQLIKLTFSDWIEDKAPRLGAAMAYYTVFSLAPLIVLAISVAGLVFGSEAAQTQMQAQLSDLLGEQAAEAVQEMVVAAQQPGRGATATIISVVLLLFGASGVFGQLQDALNTIWEVEPKPGRGILGAIKDRFLSFAMVMGTGFLFLVSLMLTAAVSTLGKWAGGLLPGPEILDHVLTLMVSFVVVTTLFAMIFKLVPDAKTAWRDVWIGAVFTAIFFTIGKYALGVYLGRSSAATSYGAASSMILVLVWVYYSSQILFLGAEFTQAYARMYGSQIEPAADAVPVTPADRAEQGLK